MELIDVLDEKTGEKTGETISKDEAHKIGKWHGSIHILIVNNNKDKTLLQKRCAEKKLYPNTRFVFIKLRFTKYGLIQTLV